MDLCGLTRLRESASDLPVTLYGGAGDDKLYAGRGNTVLLGEVGSDRLQAGPGRNLLIGGDGQDTLRGNSGQNILIGGRTTYDNNDAALAAIMAEWTSTRSFKQRCADLSAGINDPTLGLIQLAPGSSVLESATAARDAFFGSLKNNWIVDYPTRETDGRGREND